MTTGSSGPPAKAPEAPRPAPAVTRAPSPAPRRQGSIPDLPSEPPGRPPTVPPPPPPRKRAVSATHELRDRVLNAAVELASEEGVSRLSLREAARRVGVTHPAVYRYFPDKASLLAAVAEEGFRALREELVKDSMTPLEAQERVKSLILSYLAFATGHPTHFRIMFGPEAADKEAYPTLRSSEAAAFNVFVDAVIEGQRARSIRSGDPRELALALWVTTHGYAALVLDGLVEWIGLSSTQHEHLADVLSRLLFEGIAGGSILPPVAIFPTPSP